MIRKASEIHYQGDLLPGQGTVLSSSFVVGLLRALLELRGQSVSKHELALKAIELKNRTDGRKTSDARTRWRFPMEG